MGSGYPRASPRTRLSTTALGGRREWVCARRSPHTLRHTKGVDMTNATTDWHPGPAELRAILNELRPVIDECAHLDDERVELLCASTSTSYGAPHAVVPRSPVAA